VATFMNTAAFERRPLPGIHALRGTWPSMAIAAALGCVVPHMPIKDDAIGWRGYPKGITSYGSGALLAPYFTVRLSRAPCRPGASTLSVQRRIYERGH